MAGCFRASSRLSWLNGSFVLVSTLGSLVMALVCALGSADVQVGALGAMVSMLAGLVLGFLEQEYARYQRQAELLRLLAVPVALADDAELLGIHESLRDALNLVALQPDPILREIARLKAASMQQEIASLADGTLVFMGTETWRTVNEKVIASPDVREYLSVALVRSEDYWQDPPGRRSLLVNFDALRRGVLVQRVVILADSLWPAHEPLPTGVIGRWIQVQHRFDLPVSLVRESQLVGESDLLGDIGIYGSRAVGTQELDERARTVRFVLQFDAEAIRLARERWQRLLLFATPYGQLLDPIREDR
jgi:hypothetical protein